jgi:hypothetical protein
MKKITLFISALAWSGCALLAVQKPTPPLTFDEIIKWSQDHVAVEDIMVKILKSNTVFKLSSDEIVELRKQGVDSKVVDLMMDTYMEQVRRDQALEDFSRWAVYGGHYYWWPDWDNYWDRYYRPGQARPRE